MAPAHPHATWVAMYPALFCFQLRTRNSITGLVRLWVHPSVRPLVRHAEVVTLKLKTRKNVTRMLQLVFFV